MQKEWAKQERNSSFASL